MIGGVSSVLVGHLIRYGVFLLIASEGETYFNDDDATLGITAFFAILGLITGFASGSFAMSRLGSAMVGLKAAVAVLIPLILIVTYQVISDWETEMDTLEDFFLPALFVIALSASTASITGFICGLFIKMCSIPEPKAEIHLTPV